MKPLTFSEEVYQKQLNTCNVALTNSNYPPSGSFEDVSNKERFTFRFAGGSQPDPLVFQIQQAAAVDGTPKDITGAVVTMDDDNQQRTIEIQKSRLDINNGYRYVTAKLTGVSGSNYASIELFGIGPDTSPVTQPEDYVEAVNIEG